MDINHLVIVGPTASGKTSLSLKLAKIYGGEVIAADSRTVYKGMDIGTAKPTAKDQEQVKHHCLDIVFPDQNFTVADFKHNAKLALGGIENKNKLAITVGGSGLYINSFVYDYSLINHDNKILQNYKDESIEDLQKMIIEKGLTMPENYKNKRYLLNTLARGGKEPASRDKPPKGTIVIGINPADEDLKNNIKMRTEWMFDNDVIIEVRDLTAKYGMDCRAMQGGVYKELQYLINNQEDIDSAKNRIRTSDWQLARRQRTWFKRDDNILWFESVRDAESWLIERFRGKL